METLNKLLPFISLVIAALAVFIGPFITLFVTKRQSEASLKVTNKQIIAPMRQVWINSLRDLLAELCGKFEHYWATDYEDRSEDEYRHISELIHKVTLFINPEEQDHSSLVSEIGKMHNALSSGSSPELDRKFWDAHKNTMCLSQKILKQEWVRVKEEI